MYIKSRYGSTDHPEHLPTIRKIYRPTLQKWGGVPPPHTPPVGTPLAIKSKQRNRTSNDLLGSTVRIRTKLNFKGNFCKVFTVTNKMLELFNAKQVYEQNFEEDNHIDDVEPITFYLYIVLFSHSIMLTLFIIYFIYLYIYLEFQNEVIVSLILKISLLHFIIYS